MCQINVKIFGNCFIITKNVYCKGITQKRVLSLLLNRYNISQKIIYYFIYQEKYEDFRNLPKYAKSLLYKNDYKLGK